MNLAAWTSDPQDRMFVYFRISGRQLCGFGYADYSDTNNFQMGFLQLFINATFCTDFLVSNDKAVILLSLS